MPGRVGGGAHPPLPNTSLYLRRVARHHSGNARALRRYFLDTPARPRYFSTRAAGNIPTPMSWGSPHQVDSLLPLPPPGVPLHASIPIYCGPWHNGAGHFVTFYMCPEYWSNLDPLEADLLELHRMQFKLHRVLGESLTFHNLPIPPLPVYRQLPIIAIQRGDPRPVWSCGMFTVSTTLYLLLGGIPPTLSRFNLSPGSIC
jgi:hypothetical protein